MTEPRTKRTSDRLLTPAVLVAVILVGGACVALTIAAVTWMTVRGIDPDPMLRLVTEVTGAVGILINLMVSIGGRAGVAKVERTTGLDLPAKVDEMSAKLDRALWVDQQSTTALPPVPPAIRDTQRHPFGRHGAAPAGTGSNVPA